MIRLGLECEAVRCFGLEAGTRARSTVERLEAAARAGLVSEEERATLVEAFRFVLGLWLRRQVDAASRRAPTSTKLALSELSAVERTRLNDRVSHRPAPGLQPTSLGPPGTSTEAPRAGGPIGTGDAHIACLSEVEGLGCPFRGAPAHLLDRPRGVGPGELVGGGTGGRDHRAHLTR